jgi:non-ribosomal peptide synthetase component F
MVSRRVGRQPMEGFWKLCQQEGATLFMGLLAAVKVLLHRYTGQIDLIIGSPIAGRDHADLEGQIGCYINTLALRTQFRGENSFKELLSNIREVTLAAYEHQEYPFDELVDELHFQRDMSRGVLFDVMVVLQNTKWIGSGGDVRMKDIKVSRYRDGEYRISKFDLSFNFVEIGEELHYSLEYNSDIYERRTVEQLGEHLEQLVEAILVRPDEPIGLLEYLSREEKRWLLEGLNDTVTNHASDKTIIQLFEEQVEKTPENIAMVFKQRELSYRELNEQSNRLAHYLRQIFCVGPDDLVGVLLGRSERLVVSMLGVMKSGGVYVPMDPEYEKAKLDYILAESGCKVILDEHELQKFYEEEQTYDKQNPISVNTLTDLAYVIYTFEPAGKPKGVMIEHRNLVSFFINSGGNLLGL